MDCMHFQFFCVQIIVILEFFTTYDDQKTGLEIFDKKKIAINYLKYCKYLSLEDGFS